MANPFGFAHFCYKIILIIKILIVDIVYVVTRSRFVCKIFFYVSFATVIGDGFISRIPLRVSGGFFFVGGLCSLPFYRVPQQLVRVKVSKYLEV